MIRNACGDVRDAILTSAVQLPYVWFSEVAVDDG